jgi:ADP-L-glycero-D-manno-heptose 6-epimerase
MILITGGAGFIGANLIRKFNNQENSNIIIVDNLKKNQKNIKKLKFKDYFDKNDFIELVERNKINIKINCIIHLGACSDTTENNWDYLKFNNIYYTKKLFELSKSINSQFIYASSASIYGKYSGYNLNNVFNHKPLNLYGKSKLEIDKFFFQRSVKNVIGLRFFNVYGNLENHKKNMSSPVTKFTNQLKKDKYCNLFKFKPENEPSRDFIHVKDTIKVLEFIKRSKKRGIYNVGTGKAEQFTNVAKIIIQNLKYGKIKFIKFPDQLKNKYQYHTKANILKVKRMGFKNNFMDLNTGIKDYLKYDKLK